MKIMKYRKIGYWTLTIIFAGMMLLSSFLYLTHNPALVKGLQSLGYPEYLLNILGTAKLLGVIALLQTRSVALKEWAYAGFTFNLIGAAWSHLAEGQPATMVMVLFFVLLGSYILNKRLQAHPEANAASVKHQLA